MQPDEKANCNILLRDGTMLSLQPRQLRQSQAYIPFSLMDDNVLDQLKTLQENLDKVVKLGKRTMKWRVTVSDHKLAALSNMLLMGVENTVN